MAMRAARELRDEILSGKFVLNEPQEPIVIRNGY
jgi:hypothetical protein